MFNSRILCSGCPECPIPDEPVVVPTEEAPQTLIEVTSAKNEQVFYEPPTEETVSEKDKVRKMREVWRTV